MPRSRRKQFDRVSDFVGEQVAQLSRKYHRFRFIFFATFLLIGAANLAVAGLALTVMVRVIQNGRFDSLGIVALAAASASLINLILVGVNAVLRYSYKKDIYAQASKTIRNAYVHYVYGLGRYEEGGIDVFKRDIQNIVDDVTRKRVSWWKSLVQRTVAMDGV